MASIAAGACGQRFCSSSSSLVNQQPNMDSVKTLFTFEKESKTFRPGEIIRGKFAVLSAPWNAPEINGLLMDFEGEMSKDATQGKVKIVGHRQFFYGTGEKSVGQIKEAEYEFQIQVPEDVPNSVATGDDYGLIKYTVKCIAILPSDHKPSRHSFDPESVSIFNDSVNEWPNQKLYMEPMFDEREISKKIQLRFKTDRKGYEPGKHIQFVVYVDNRSGKNIRGMTLQLQRKLKWQDQPFITELVGEQVHGPNVPINLRETWVGFLKTPFELRPSIPESNLNLPMTFQYSLQLTLLMSGPLTSNISEDFQVDFGSSLNPAVEARRPSMTSVTPSLPDYETALDRMRGEDVA